MHTWYNEFEPQTAAWLRELVARRLLPEGEIDERDIRELSPDDLVGVGHAHFFAGIGGWARALQLSGWPDDVPLWTGSCPCQPFSVAGRGRGVDDPRHLWPTWFELIRECRPAIIVGEQSASPAGRAWFDLVSADLEGMDYACAAADLCAAGIGAPHIRQRLFFVAVVGSERTYEWRPAKQGSYWEEVGVSRTNREAGELGDPRGTGGQGDDRAVFGTEEEGARERGLARCISLELVPPGATRGFWRDADWLLCRDGKARPVRSGTFPLAHGVPARLGRLRGYGNAIVPQLAAAFLETVMEILSEGT